jgi:hypothetical protein
MTTAEEKAERTVYYNKSKKPEKDGYEDTCEVLKAHFKRHRDIRQKDVQYVSILSITLKKLKNDPKQN